MTPLNRDSQGCGLTPRVLTQLCLWVLHTTHGRRYAKIWGGQMSRKREGQIFTGKFWGVEKDLTVDFYYIMKSDRKF